MMDKDQKLIWESLATNPFEGEFAALGADDQLIKNENLLRYIGVLIMTDEQFTKVKYNVLMRDDVQNYIKEFVKKPS